MHLTAHFEAVPAVRCNPVCFKIMHRYTRHYRVNGKAEYHAKVREAVVPIRSCHPVLVLM